MTLGKISFFCFFFYIYSVWHPMLKWKLCVTHTMIPGWFCSRSTHDSCPMKNRFATTMVGSVPLTYESSAYSLTNTQLMIVFCIIYLIKHYKTWLWSNLICGEIWNIRGSGHWAQPSWHHILSLNNRWPFSMAHLDLALYLSPLSHTWPQHDFLLFP
jgi:hypothetical protein